MNIFEHKHLCLQAALNLVTSNNNALNLPFLYLAVQVAIKRQEYQAKQTLEDQAAQRTPEEIEERRQRKIYAMLHNQRAHDRNLRKRCSAHKNHASMDTS